MDTLQHDVRRETLVGDERWQLVERIVGSTPFHKSARLRELLLYIAEQALCGNAQQLTEQRIGHAVFGKPADYSPLEDSSVRVHARQLRLRLHEYFDSVGTSEPLVVEIPKGGYVPTFHRAHPPGPSQDSSHVEVAKLRSSFSRFSPWILCSVLAVACLLMAWRLNGVRRLERTATAPPEPPWPLSGVFEPQRRTTIVVADANYGMLRIMSHKPGSLEEYLRPDFPANFMPSSLSSQVAPITSYISDSLLTSYADVATATSLLKLAGARGDQVSIRSARDLRLRDLDQGNFVLLGSPGSNPWVEMFQDRLNFEEREGVVGEGRKFFLNKQPAPGEQKTYEGLRWTGKAGTDYADIALLPNEQHKGEVLILQGLQQEGTEAAGLFLSDPENRRMLREALGLDSDSEGKAWFEVLIRTEAVDGTPNSGTLVAKRLIR